MKIVCGHCGYAEFTLHGVHRSGAVWRTLEVVCVRCHTVTGIRSEVHGAQREFILIFGSGAGEQPSAPKPEGSG